MRWSRPGGHRPSCVRSRSPTPAGCRDQLAVGHRRLQPGVEGRRRDHGLVFDGLVAVPLRRRPTVAAGPGLGVRLRRRRPHRYERPRRPGRQHHLGQVLERGDLQGTARRNRSFDRPRCPEGRRSHLAARSAAAGRLEQPPGRAGRRRNRQPVRSRGDGDQRDRQCTAPRDDRAEQLHDRRLDPDRRRDQPRQLGRPAARPDRKGDRGQLTDRERFRRQRRRRLRNPVEHGEDDRLEADLEWKGPARLPRRRNRHRLQRRQADPGQERTPAAAAGLRGRRRSHGARRQACQGRGDARERDRRESGPATPSRSPTSAAAPPAR